MVRLRWSCGRAGAGLVLLVLALSGAGGASRPAAAQGDSAPACPPAWQPVTSPNPGAGWNVLAGVAAAGRTDIWAVGSYIGPGPQVNYALTLHWDGHAWSNVTGPEPAQAGWRTWLRGVAAAPGEAWAAGYSGLYNTVVLPARWTGALWQTLPPAIYGHQAFLNGAATIGPHEAWLVGTVRPSNYHPSEPLILRAAPEGVTRLRAPSLHTDDEFFGVAALGPNDAWAVGTYSDSGTPHWPLAEHWNGQTWSIAPLPFPGDPPHVLNAVTMVAPDDAWAVGSAYDAGYVPFILHWDGVSWQQAPAPGEGELFGVAGAGPHDVWAVGHTDATGTHPLLLHWDGAAWTQRLVYVPPHQESSLAAITAMTPTDLWAAGNYLDPQGIRRTLLLHYTDACPTSRAAPPRR